MNAEEKFSADARAAAVKIGSKLEALLQKEIGKLGDSTLCAAVHATVIGLLQGSFYVTIRDWCLEKGLDAKDGSEELTDLIGIASEAAQALAEQHGIKVMQSFQSVVKG